MTIKILQGDCREVMATLAECSVDAILRKLAELRPVATSYTMEALVPGGTVKTHVTPLQSLPAGTALYQLSEVLTDD